MVIISHKHKFIYIKTYKTASTSIQIYLGKFCGDQDVLTPIEPVTSEIGRLYNETVKNFKGFYSHIGAKEIQKLVGYDIWNHYFKFTFERNPWDRAVSFYHFYKKTKDLSVSFEEWIQDWIKSKKRVSNYDLYTIKGKVAVDYIGKYENLELDLRYVLDKLKLPFEDLPKEKSGYRRNNMEYRSF
ncbi:unnamed protein product, partial [marine sediment metagenome]